MYDKKKCLEILDNCSEMVHNVVILLSEIEEPEEEKQFQPIHVELDKVLGTMKNYRRIIERREK